MIFLPLLLLLKRDWWCPWLLLECIFCSGICLKSGLCRIKLAFVPSKARGKLDANALSGWRGRERKLGKPVPDFVVIVGVRTCNHAKQSWDKMTCLIRNAGYLYLSPQTQSLFTWNVHRIIIELDQFIDSQFRIPDSSGRNWLRAYIFPCMLFYFHIQLIALSWITNAKDVLMEDDWTSCSYLPASSSVLVPLFSKSRL